MKKLFFGLIAIGFMTLSSFTTISNSKVSSTDDAYGCCTAHNASWSQTVTVCDDNPKGRCGRAMTAYEAIY